MKWTALSPRGAAGTDVVHDNQPDHKEHDMSPADAQVWVVGPRRRRDLTFLVMQKAIGVARRRVPGLAKMSSEQALTSIRLIDRAFRQHGVQYWLSDGTLLGLVRDGHFIGHDADTDIGVRADTFDPEVLTTLVRSGFVIDRVYGDPASCMEVCLRRKRIKTDVFFFYNRPNGKVYHSCFFRMDKQQRTAERVDFDYDAFELGEGRLLGSTFPVPAPAEEFLITKYGTSWTVPQPEWDYVAGPKNATPTGTRYGYSPLGPPLEDVVARIGRVSIPQPDVSKHDPDFRQQSGTAEC